MKFLYNFLYYKLLMSWREIRDNFFTLFILGPLILGFIYLLALPYLQALADGAYALPTPHNLALGAVVLILLLLLAPASAIITECYPLQSPDTYLDALPISTGWRFCSLLLIRAIKNLPIILIFALLHYLITGIREISPQLAKLWLFILLPLLLQLTALQLVWVLLATHFGYLRLLRLLILTIAISLLAILIPGFGRMILLPLAGIKYLVVVLIQSWFIQAALDFHISHTGTALTLAAVYFIIAFFCYKRWAIPDRDFLERLLYTHRSSNFFLRFSNVLELRLGIRVTAQLLRDLVLTARFFSSAVYISVAIALLFQLALIVFSQRITNSGLWFEIATQSACTLASFSLAVLSPILVKHQLPLIWLEQSLPLSTIEMCNNKLWYARLMAIPAPITSLIISAACIDNLTFVDTVFLSLKLLFLWLLVSSLVGILAFELASRPALAIILTAFASIAVAILTIRLWWLGLLLYLYVMDKLIPRAHTRAHLLLTGVEGVD